MKALLAKSFRDQDRALIGWSLGLVATAMLYAVFYPSVRDSAAGLNAYVDKMPEALLNLIGTDYTSPAGYLHSELFAFLGPVLFLVFAIGAGARAIAGEEEEGTLDLLLSTPLRRPDVLAGKAIALVGVTILLGGVVVVVVAIGGPPFELSVPLIDVIAACVMLALIAIAFGMIAFAAGAASGRKALAVSLAGGLAALTYIMNVLAASVERVSWLRPLSPFRWYLEPDPLRAGLDVVNVSVLLGIAVAAYVAGHVAFVKRDLTV